MPAVNLTVDENTIFLLVLESLNMFFEVAKREVSPCDYFSKNRLGPVSGQAKWS
jgi:hypothetical protein